MLFLLSRMLTRCWLLLMSMISTFEIVNPTARTRNIESSLCSTKLVSWIRLFVKFNRLHEMVTSDIRADAKQPMESDKRE